MTVGTEHELKIHNFSDERDYEYQDRPIWSDAEMTVCDLP